MHDPVMFPDPDKFDPKRFLDAKDPRLVDFDLPFGFGRRVCPGMHLARNSLFIEIARILWGFDILPDLDAHGRPVLPDPWAYTDGFNSRPLPFQCKLVPRDARVVDTIEREWTVAKAKLDAWTSGVLCEEEE